MTYNHSYSWLGLMEMANYNPQGWQIVSWLALSNKLLRPWILFVQFHVFPFLFGQQIKLCNKHLRFCKCKLHCFFQFYSTCFLGSLFIFHNDCALASVALSHCLYVFVPREVKYSLSPCGTQAGFAGRKSTCVHKEGRKPILSGPEHNTTIEKKVQAAQITTP